MGLFTRLVSRHAGDPAGAAVFWPGQCLVCHAWPAHTLCGGCVARFVPAMARCATCALPVPPAVAVCGACLRQPPPMGLCLTALPYRWPWPMCVGRWKFNGEVGLTRPLAALMRAAPGMGAALGDADLVLPMPMSPERLAARGYNPALLLARRLAPGRMRAGLLLRTRDTPPQRGLPRAQRLKNVHGAFRVDPLAARDVAGRRVVLVDDVMTTGASAREAASALLCAGAAQVAVLVLARTDSPAQT